MVPKNPRDGSYQNHVKKKKNQMTDKSTSGEVWKDPFTQQANRRSPGHDKVR